MLIHHMPGWDDASKEMARKLAYHGFVTISPNLHFREGMATPQENSTSIREKGGMPDVRTMGDVEGAMAYLRTLPYLNGKVGLIGFLLRRTPDLPGRLHAERVWTRQWTAGVVALPRATTSSPRPCQPGRWTSQKG